MGRNRVQFQKGLSMAEFIKRYGTEEQCHAALVRMRWPERFVCPACGGTEHSYSNARRIFQCSACRVQTSAKAGTIFHKSKTPLAKGLCRSKHGSRRTRLERRPWLLPRPCRGRAQAQGRRDGQRAT